MGRNSILRKTQIVGSVCQSGEVHGEDGFYYLDVVKLSRGNWGVRRVEHVQDLVNLSIVAENIPFDDALTHLYHFETLEHEAGNTPQTSVRAKAKPYYRDYVKIFGYDFDQAGEVFRKTLYNEAFINGSVTKEQFEESAFQEVVARQNPVTTLSLKAEELPEYRTLSKLDLLRLKGFTRDKRLETVGSFYPKVTKDAKLEAMFVEGMFQALQEQTSLTKEDILIHLFQEGFKWQGWNEAVFLRALEEPETVPLAASFLKNHEDVFCQEACREWHSFSALAYWIDLSNGGENLSLLQEYLAPIQESIANGRAYHWSSHYGFSELVESAGDCLSIYLNKDLDVLDRSFKIGALSFSNSKLGLNSAFRQTISTKNDAVAALLIRHGAIAHQLDGSSTEMQKCVKLTTLLGDLLQYEMNQSLEVLIRQHSDVFFHQENTAAQTPLNFYIENSGKLGLAHLLDYGMKNVKEFDLKQAGLVYSAIHADNYHLFGAVEDLPDFFAQSGYKNSQQIVDLLLGKSAWNSVQYIVENSEKPSDFVDLLMTRIQQDQVEGGEAVEYHVPFSEFENDQFANFVLLLKKYGSGTKAARENFADYLLEQYKSYPHREMEIVTAFELLDLPLNYQNLDGNSLSHIAKSYGSSYILSYLEKDLRADFSLENKWGKTPKDIQTSELDSKADLKPLGNDFTSKVESMVKDKIVRKCFSNTGPTP